MNYEVFISQIREVADGYRALLRKYARTDTPDAELIDSFKKVAKDADVLASTLQGHSDAGVLTFCEYNVGEKWLQNLGTETVAEETTEDSVPDEPVDAPVEA